jgi:propionyl-CoA carboxylase alpha chain
MISRLLIANRGEIAARIARTAHAMGMSTVGVYSEPDRNAVHVDAVDVAVALGGSTPAESYLRADAIIQAALDTGADAIHPGYGFLAENADFAEAVEAAGLVWVGPTPEQIRLLGDKVAAKAAAIDAGVPTTPITEVTPGAVLDEVPMPALVKAAAGGGGRGMRIVHAPDELPDAVEAAAREAEAAFGDGTVFIEPYIERGRHLEVQILGDAHGNVVHFGERECSIQRRNQKVIEEAPSAGIDDATRAALLDGALALANHVGYRNAGTVEFLVSEPDEDGERPTITFLEVNTRLQVEHPVTEAVTGVDLVELQLRVAAGERLPLTQDDIRVVGHGIEVRIVAEDPTTGWLPSTGTVAVFDIGDSVRVDTGFRAGSEVSADYDSLLAKVIAHAPTRQRAAATMARALRHSQIVGVRTNVDMLTAAMSEEDYLAAATPTAYLAEHPEVEAATGPAGDELDAMVVAATLVLEAAHRTADGVLGFAPSGWRNVRTRGQRRTWLDGDTVHPIEYVRCGDGAGVRLGGWPEPSEDGSLPDDTRAPRQARVIDHSGDRIALELDGRRRVFRVQLMGDADEAVANVAGPAGARSFTLAQRFEDHDAEQTGGGPICPLPGTVIAVHVAEGETVTEGQLLMVVEAMKMEHKITAGAPGTVTALRFAEGDRVDTGDLLVELESD